MLDAHGTPSLQVPEHGSALSNGLVLNLPRFEPVSETSETTICNLPPAVSYLERQVIETVSPQVIGRNGIPSRPRNASGTGSFCEGINILATAPMINDHSDGFMPVRNLQNVA